MSPKTMSQKYRNCTSEVTTRRNSSGCKKVARLHGGAIAGNYTLFQLNVRRARATWGVLSRNTLQALKDLSERHSLEVAAGELQFLNNGWYVTHAGLLHIALHNGCAGIRTIIEKGLSDPASSRWVFKATVYK